MLNPRDFQSLYPQPEEKSGMAARKPTYFTVPVVKTTLLFFLPVAFLTLLPALYVSSDEVSRATYATSSIALFSGTLVAILLSIVFLAIVRLIVVRNCSRPFIVGALYFGVVIPTGVFLVDYGAALFGGYDFYTVLAIEAGVLLAECLALALVARFLAKH